MNVVGIIPARMASSRFPGKPLAPILGTPMIGHVFHRARLSTRLNRVYIATCDAEIAEYGRSIAADVVMTAATHQRASDRAAEAADTIERDTGRRLDIVVMIQGDEPMIAPAMVDAAVDALITDPRADVVNLMGRLDDRAGLEDPNEIKVVVDRENFALYFSRSPVPFVRDGGRWGGRNQICVIPFRRDALTEFNALPPTPLEVAESIDMLRLLEHGRRVKMAPVEAETCSVDTPEDLAAVEALMASDPLVRQYGSRSG
jgi:3-deoxy-manno-octulosonate cytidylyltransferase (CMP-KDO synthetase)